MILETAEKDKVGSLVDVLELDYNPATPALLSVPRTEALVSKFASSQAEFEDAFVKSMIKMSSLAGGVEVRHNCRVVN